MRIHGIKDVDHAASSRFSRGPETFVIVKVEDNIRAKTRATRSDRWQDETFNIDIDKANEIELTVYDKSGDRPIPIGFLWIRISDIAEEMRRKKIESEFQSAGWVSADKMANGGGGKPMPEFNPPPASTFMPPGDSAGAGTIAGHAQPPSQVMIDSWFSLEPAGRIQLSMGFQKQTGGRRPLDLGLNRQGAVRQKKEEVIEKQGHKFVKQQFYNVMRCALCGDFLKYSAGCSAATANIPVTPNAIPRSLRSVSARRTTKQIPMRKRSTIVSLIASTTSRISVLIGAATVVICCRWVERMRRNAQSADLPVMQAVSIWYLISVACL